MAGNKIKLINLDDEIIDREIAKIMCGMIGVECVSVSDPEEYLQVFQKFDGAILDFSLPDRDGGEVAKLTRVVSESYPLIFRSNYPAGSPQHETMLTYGPVIEKGVSPTALKELKDFTEEIRKKKIASDS